MQVFGLTVPELCIMNIDLSLNMLLALPLYHRNISQCFVKGTFAYRFVLAPPQLFSLETMKFCIFQRSEHFQIHLKHLTLRYFSEKKKKKEESSEPENAEGANQEMLREGTRVRIHSSISVLSNPYPFGFAFLLFGQKTVRPVSHYP